MAGTLRTPVPDVGVISAQLYAVGAPDTLIETISLTRLTNNLCMAEGPIASSTGFNYVRLVESGITAGAFIVNITGSGTYDAVDAASPNWEAIRNPTAAVNLSATNIDADQVVASVSGSVNSVTTGVTLAASAVQAIWDALTSALTTVGSIGKKLADWVIGSPMQAGSTVVLTDASLTTAKLGTFVLAKTTNITGFNDIAAGTAMTLTPAEREATAVVVEAHLLDEGDTQLLINAIVGAIGNTNIDEVVLVAAIRADLERSGGNLNTLLARLTSGRAANLDNLDATVTSRATPAQVATALANYDGPTNSELEARTLVAADYGTAANQTTINNNLLSLPGIITLNHGPGSYERNTEPDNTGIAAAAADAAELNDTKITMARAAVLADWIDGGRLDLILDAILDDTGTAGVAMSAAQLNRIADHVRRRTQANVESSSDGDSLSVGSEYGFIQSAQESAVVGGVLTIRRTDGTTTLGTKALVSSASAEPITAIS